MNEWSLSMNSLFIGLFLLIIMLYVNFFIQTMVFVWRKRKIKTMDTWKKRFPLIRHATATNRKQTSRTLFAIFTVCALAVGWIQLGGEVLYSFFFVFSLFALSFVTRECSLHYLLAKDELIVWSVHNAPYPTVSGEKRIYRHVLLRRSIHHVEEVSYGFHVYIEKEVYVVVAVDGERKNTLRAWFPKKQTHIPR